MAITSPAKTGSSPIHASPPGTATGSRAILQPGPPSSGFPVLGSMLIARSALPPRISSAMRTTRTGFPSTGASTASAVATPWGWPSRPPIHLTMLSPAVVESPSNYFFEVRP